MQNWVMLAAVSATVLFAMFFLQGHSSPEEQAYNEEMARHVEDTQHEEHPVVVDEEEQLALTYPVAPPESCLSRARELGLPVQEGVGRLPIVLGQPEADDGLPIVVFLHGRAEDNERRLNFFHSLRHTASVVLPFAPIRDMGAVGILASWYAYARSDSRRADDLIGLPDSMAYVQTLVMHLQRRFRKHIILAGFSQGGVVAAAAAYSAPLREPVFALLLLSAYISMPGGALTHLVRGTRVYCAHSKQDHVISHQWAVATCDALQKAGAPAKTIMSPTGGHYCLRPSVIQLFHDVIAAATAAKQPAKLAEQPPKKEADKAAKKEDL